MIMLIIIIGPFSDRKNSIRQAFAQARMSPQETLVDFLQKQFDEHGIDSVSAVDYMRQNPDCCGIMPVTYDGWFHKFGNYVFRGWVGAPRYLISTYFGYSVDSSIYSVFSTGRLNNSGILMSFRSNAGEKQLTGRSKLVCDAVHLETGRLDHETFAQPMHCWRDDTVRQKKPKRIVDGKILEQVRSNREGTVHNCNWLGSSGDSKINCDGLTLPPYPKIPGTGKIHMLRLPATKLPNLPTSH